MHLATLNRTLLARIAGLAFALALAPVALVACGDDDDDTDGTDGANTGDTDNATDTGKDTGDEEKEFSIPFKAVVGSQPASCTGMFALGTQTAKASITDMRFYITNPRFTAHDNATEKLMLVPDGKFQSDTIALLDFEDKTGSCANGTAETNTVLKVKAPAEPHEGHYDGMSFSFDIAVPAELNHADVATAPAPLNVTSLFWNWNGGYKYMRVDLAPMEMDMGNMGTKATAAHGGGGFFVHLGATGCNGADATSPSTTCTNSNRATVTLTGNVLTGGKTVVFDIAELVKGLDLTKNTADTAPGCMSAKDDPECGPVFTHLGLDLPTGTVASAAQTVFFLE